MPIFFSFIYFLYSVRSPLSQIDWPVDNFGRLDHMVDPYQAQVSNFGLVVPSFQAQDSIFFRLNFFYGFKNSPSQGFYRNLTRTAGIVGVLG